MTAPDSYEPDELEMLLGASTEVTTTDSTLHRELLLRTRRVIRRRRHVRRFGILAAVACAYLAGALTVSLLPSRAEIIVAESSASQLATARQDHQNEPQPSEFDPSDVVASAFEVPLGAVDESNRYELFRRAADRHLMETGDFTAALNLYRQALNTANEDELAIAAGRDTWLLMALKNARQQERTDAKRET